MDGMEIHECERAWDATDPHPCEGAVELVNDPYDEEINEERIPVWLCDYHYEQRALEI